MSAITVYSKPACYQCVATTRYLKKRGADFTVIDITQDPEARKLVGDLGHQSAPVVVSGDVHFSSFRPDALDALIAKRSAAAA